MNPSKASDLHVTPEEIEKGYEDTAEMFKEVYPQIPTPVLDEFRTYTTIESFKKGKLLIDYGDICRKLLIIIRGYVIIHLNVDGREVPVWFVGKGKITVAVQSFLRQVPSGEKQVAVEDTICIALDRDKYQMLYDKHYSFQKLKENLLEFYYYEALLRIKLTYSTPEDRYRHLMETWPHIIMKAKISELAPYLGIRRETLSRKRAEIRKGKN